MKYFIIILSVLFLGTACSSIPTIPDAPKALAEYDPPTWVLNGGGAFTDMKGKAFYGVGSATGIKNYSLQRTIAEYPLPFNACSISEASLPTSGGLTRNRPPDRIASTYSIDSMT